MDQTFVCCSTYHVYISILEAHKYRKQGYESILIFFDDVITGIEGFLQNVDDIGIFKKVIVVKGYTIMRNLKKKHSFWKYITGRSKIIVDLYEKNNTGLVDYDAFIAGSEINLFQINRTRAYFLIKYKKNFFRMYEDGYGTYQQKLPAIRRFNRKYITKLPLLKGHDPQVKEVWVNFPERVTDKVLIPKLKKLDILSLEAHLNESEKDNVVECMIGNITLRPDRSTIIITQPLSEDDFCSEAIKINLYEGLVEQELAAGNIVYIKTHPRERTIYPFRHENTMFLPKYFPLEVFNLSSKVHIAKAVSYFSTALFNLKHVENKVLLGEDFLVSEIEKIKAGKS
jgi:hypothetical protein